MHKIAKQKWDAAILCTDEDIPAVYQYLEEMFIIHYPFKDIKLQGQAPMVFQSKPSANQQIWHRVSSIFNVFTYYFVSF